MDRSYLERAARDLRQRISSLLVNDQQVGIRKIEQLGTDVIVTTDQVSRITKITSVKLLDESDGLITQRTAHLDVPDGQIIEFRFQFAVKGEAL